MKSLFYILLSVPLLYRGCDRDGVKKEIPEGSESFNTYIPDSRTDIYTSRHKPLPAETFDVTWSSCMFVHED